MTKLRMKKSIEISLSAVLTIVLIAAVIAELFVLYKYFYLNLNQEPEVVAQQVKSGINNAAYEQVKSQVGEKKAYFAPASVLPEGTLRPNPFAEYR